MNGIKRLREVIFGEAEDAASESFQEKLILLVAATATGIIIGLLILLVWVRIYPKLMMIKEAKDQIEMQFREAVKNHSDSHAVMPSVIISREPETPVPPMTYQRPKIKPVEGILESERVKPVDTESAGDDNAESSENTEKTEEKRIF